MKKAILCSILAMFVFILSCAAGTGNADSGTTAAYKTDETDQTTLPAADIPGDAFYDGYVFNILLSGNWDFDDFTAEEENGEPVNDAIFKKNLAIKERFGIDIELIEYQTNASGGNTVFRNSVTADDNAFDCAMIGSYQVTLLTTDGYLIDLNSMPYMDLEKPWWDQKANEDLTMKGMMFYTTGDITTLLNDCTYCFLFNKKLIVDYNMDNPYDMVRDSSWTVDNVSTMIRQVSGDVDGSGTYNQADLYGLIAWDDSMLGIITGTGEKFATLNKSSELELTLNNERVISVMEKYIAIVFDETITYHIIAGSDHSIDIFSDNRGLFYTRYLRAASWFRDMETDFGILPYPKLEETQDRYYSNVHAYGSSFICVPVTCDDTERTGIILEALAAESYYTLKPAYYETTLVGKYIRDDESIAMLDIILANRVYDLGLYYQLGTYNERLMDLLRQRKGDFISTYAKHETSALAQIEKVNTAFSEFLEGQQ
ncbi:MAG: hypothetical protein PHZ09_12525 [Eubacteriales bacterium]|nr:hypothetical protein [Eubacteriales bacterium]